MWIGEGSVEGAWSEFAGSVMGNVQFTKSKYLVNK